MRTITLILMAAAVVSAADLDNNTLTVTATRTLNIQPDQALVSVNLVVARDAGLDDVLAKLNGTGITAANLTSVSQVLGSTAAAGGPYSEWMFSVQVPFSNLKSTLAALIQAQASLGQISGSNALSYYISGTQVSADAQAAQPCPFTALVSDARRQADTMAAAAGMRTGAITTVSDGTSVETTGATAAAIAVPTSACRIGDFSALYGTIVSSPALIPVASPGLSAGVVTIPVPCIATFPQPSCSLTVQFKLIQ